MRRDGGQFGPQRPLVAKAGAEDDGVGHHRAFGGVDSQRTVRALLDAQHRSAQVEMRIPMCRDTQGAAVWRWHLLDVEVMPEAPFPLVGQRAETVRHAGVAGPLALVDARQVGTADQQIHPRCAAFERRCRDVHRRSAAADHRHPQAAKACAVPCLTRMHPALARDLLRPVRHPRAAQAITSGGQHDMVGQHRITILQRVRSRTRIGLVSDIELHQSIRARLHGDHALLVAHVQPQDLAVPAQVVGPLQARDLVERVPSSKAELRLEPGAKSQ